MSEKYIVALATTIGAVIKPDEATVATLASEEVWLPKTPSELKIQRFRAFMRSWWYLDELSFRRPFRSGSVQFSNSCRTTGGDPRASSPTRRFPKERVASSAPPALRPALVDLALAMVAGWRHSLHIVRPDTVIAWHRRAFAGYWTRKSRRRQG